MANQPGYLHEKNSGDFKLATNPFLPSENQESSFSKYDSALAEQLSKDFRTENLVSVKSQGHQVEALNPDRHKPQEDFRTANDNSDPAHRNTHGGPNMAEHPLMPNMEGMSPDQVVIPEEVKAEQTFGATKLSAQNRHKQKMKNRMPGPKPKPRLANAPKMRHTERPRPKPPGT